jgi:hypothetical protein
LLDVVGHFCLDWGGVVGDSCCTENLLEDGLKGLRVDVVVDEFLADAGAAKVMVAVDVMGGAAFANRS